MTSVQKVKLPQYLSGMFQIVLYLSEIRIAIDILPKVRYRLCCNLCRTEGGILLFDYVSTYRYGRSTNPDDWQVKPTGLNRVCVIRSGKITLMLGSGPYELKPGTLYLFPQCINFLFLLPGSTDADYTFLDFFTRPIINMKTPIAAELCHVPFLGSAARILFEIVEAHQTYVSLERNAYSDLVDSYLNNLLFLIDTRTPVSTVSDTRINLALDYIHKNYKQDITVTALSKLVNLEQNYFIHLFGAHVNATPYQYISKYRFAIALAMIRQNLSLAEIAREVGYSDCSSFSHAFKRIYGVSPSSLRKRAN